MTAPEIEQSYGVEDVARAWGLSPDRIKLWMARGEIGYIRAGRSRRLLAEHVAQIKALIEVRPAEPTRINTRRSVPRRTRRSVA